jgi:hypothetical protein
MALNQIHISAAEMDVLSSTAELGNCTVEDLLVAAAWAFEQHDEDFKKHYLRGMWLGGNSSLPMHGKFSLWRTVSIPSSTKNILRKNARDDFSPIQKLGAAIRLYTTLRPQERFQLALEYTERWKSHKGSRSLATNSPPTP